MAYNNFFPAGYQPMYYPQSMYNQPQQVAQQTLQQPQQVSQQTEQTQPVLSGKIWVTEDEVDKYLVAPNTAIDLWDKKSQVIYIKSADAFGRTHVECLDYTFRKPKGEVPQNASGFDAGAFATKDELKGLTEQLAKLQNKLDGLLTQSDGTPKKEVAENE